MTSQILKTGRAPLVDLNQWVDSLIASYKKEIERNVGFVKGEGWMAHAIQKEAIQNSSDAIDKNSDERFSITFEMDDAFPVRFISITDTGTYGLTGKSFILKNELNKLQQNEPQKYQQERWVRFEALSFPNIDPIGRGSKGQGKWAFVGASQNKTIFYDTLRKDGIYRAGGWLGQEQLIEEPPEGMPARQLLKAQFNLEPLQHIGTRIVIKSPRKELMEGFYPLTNCPMMQYIQETWWELLKSGAQVFLKRGQFIIKIEPASCYSDTFINSNVQDIWTSKNCDLYWAKNTQAKVKELVIILAKNTIPEEFRGISIQRNGMKIRSFDVQMADPRITPEFAERIFGWVSFNKESEEELRQIEDTTHYDFSSSIGSFGARAQ
jgi:hypothetical protein